MITRTTETNGTTSPDDGIGAVTDAATVFGAGHQPALVPFVDDTLGDRSESARNGRSAHLPIDGNSNPTPGNHR